MHEAISITLIPSDHTWLWVILGISVVGLVYSIYLMLDILKADTGTKKMREIALAIQEGANAYMNRQFKTVIFLVILLAAGLYVLVPEGIEPEIRIGRSLAFLLGCFFSALTGFTGMSMAVRGNVRVAAAARTSLKDSLTLAFRTGTIPGMVVVGLGLLGATAIFMIYEGKAPEVLLGFGFGGCLLALFMRVGGGIFTKAADVGADLVGKLEKNIPEDDPRNAATIADNVGDNVGDCAGMAADIFESYEVTLVAAMILGAASFGAVGVLFPLLVRAIGVITSIIGTWMVRSKSETEYAMRPIQRGFIWSSVLSVIGFAIVAWKYIPARYLVDHPMDTVGDAQSIAWKFFFATLFGIILAVIISQLTEHYTSTERAPVKGIAKATQAGPATTILEGFAVGLESTVWAVFVIVASVFASMLIFDTPEQALYGIALCGMGMLTCTGVIVAEDSFGPVADNANGIGEMAGLPKSARKIMDQLDAVGNSTKAITKGFAIASAVLAAVSLFGSYAEIIFARSGLHINLDVGDPRVFIGLLIGGAIPFLFSSMMIRAVSRSAFRVVAEVRRQFKEIKGIMSGKGKPEYAKVVDICTQDSLKELIGPGLLAVLTPIIIGFVFKAEALGGFLAGIILTGQLMAVMLSNAGGAWDNAKKSIEDGLYGGKGSSSHEASVIGDTVGDPFKDTAGPALNPLIKVMNLVALLIAPLLVTQGNLTPDLDRAGWVGIGIAVLVVAGAVYYSKREGD